MNNAMTIDVEEYFQVSAFSSVISKRSWDNYESRVCESVVRILELFNSHNAKGTFFVLGWVAEKNPKLIRMISNAGHEIASHGMHHDRVNEITRYEFEEDLVRSRKLLEDITGKAVKGYRAPSFSLPLEDWSYDVIAESGYQYSSSIYPIKHDHYGHPEANRFFFVSKSGVMEYPISTLRVMGRNIPIGGGGYFRVLPYLYYRAAINSLNYRENMSSIFYFHPWEIDEHQPRQAGLNTKAKFRHYVNLKKTFRKLDCLLAGHSWSSIEDVYQL